MARNRNKRQPNLAAQSLRQGQNQPQTVPAKKHEPEVTDTDQQIEKCPECNVDPVGGCASQNPGPECVLRNEDLDPLDVLDQMPTNTPADTQHKEDVGDEPELSPGERLTIVMQAQGKRFVTSEVQPHYRITDIAGTHILDHSSAPGTIERWLKLYDE